MQPIFFVLAIMGCGEDQSGCQQARVEPVRYETAAQCRAALPDALVRNTDLDYPVVSAACRSNGPQWVANPDAPRG